MFRYTSSRSVKIAINRPMSRIFGGPRLPGLFWRNFDFFGHFCDFLRKKDYFLRFLRFFTKNDFSIFFDFLRWFWSRLVPEIARRDQAKNDKIGPKKVTLGHFGIKMVFFEFFGFGANFGPLTDF